MRRAEFVCCCNWPLSQFFCSDDLAKHTACPSSAFPHRPLPISVLNKLTLKPQFDQFLVRSDELELEKVQLLEEIDKRAKMSDKFNEMCGHTICKLQELQVWYRTKVDTECQNLKEEVQMLINEEGRRLTEFESMTQDLLPKNVNQSILDLRKKLLSMKSDKFLNFKFAKSLQVLVSEYRNGMNAKKIISENKNIQEFRATAGRYTKKLKEAKLKGASSISNLEAQITTATLCCCLPFCLCWPLVGFWQAMNRDNLESGCGCDIIQGTYLCLLPTLLCCLGAAINRRTYMQRVGIKTNFLVDLSFFSMHIWNTCLVCQEAEIAKTYHLRRYD